MPTTLLTSWKEIAQYLGKGVRTAQRWEHELGLPVRRPEKRCSKSSVLIETAELDRWIRCTFNRDKSPDKTLPLKLDWELLDRSRRLIEESTILVQEHLSLLQQTRQTRVELEKSRLSYGAGDGEAIQENADDGLF